MKTQKENTAESLRQKAEAIANENLKNNESLSEGTTKKLINGLHVHQIELEMQNLELQSAIDQLEIDKKKYSLLYDNTPNGYFTISNEGDILELNTTGAKMLAKEHSRLIMNRFVLFVSPDTRPVFNQFLDNVFNGISKETCEIILLINDCLPMYVILTGIISENRKHCNVTMVDITDHKLAEIKLLEANEKAELCSANFSAILGSSIDNI